MNRKEATECIKRFFTGIDIALSNQTKEAFNTLIPELAESEDERIRKALVKEFEDRVQRCFEWKDGIPNNAVLDWLKKQKEQKPVEWSEEDKDMIVDIIDIIQGVKAVSKIDLASQERLAYYDKEITFLKSLLEGVKCRLKTEWSEEDQTLLSDALGCVTMVQELKKRGELKNFHISCTGEELRSWIRIRSWKPSEEQMGALNYAYCELFKREDVGHNILGPLQSLVDTLRKL